MLRVAVVIVCFAAALARLDESVSLSLNYCELKINHFLLVSCFLMNPKI